MTGRAGRQGARGRRAAGQGNVRVRARAGNWTGPASCDFSGCRPHLRQQNRSVFCPEARRCFIMALPACLQPVCLRKRSHRELHAGEVACHGTARVPACPGGIQVSSVSEELQSLSALNNGLDAPAAVRGGVAACLGWRCGRCHQASRRQLASGHQAHIEECT